MAAQEQPAFSPPNQWQRTCRWLKRVMAFLWGSVILTVLVNVVSTIFTSTSGTSLSKLLVVHLVLTYPIPVISGAGVFLLLTIVSWIGSHERKASSSLPPEQQSRLIILKSLRRAYSDELDSSLQGMARIALGLHERFDLTHPARLSSWRPGQSERTLSEGITIVDVLIRQAMACSSLESQVRVNRRSCTIWRRHFSHEQNRMSHNRCQLS